MRQRWGSALEHVLRQIIREIPLNNLIVVYGSSKDKTKEVAEKFTKNVFWDEDKGLGAARNLGIRMASSTFVAMIDTDLILPRDWCKRILRNFEDSKVAAAMGYTIYGYGCPPVQHLFEYWRRRNSGSYGCTNTIFRRNLVLEIGNFNADIRGAGEDYDLYKRVCSAGYKWAFDRETISYHPMRLFEFFHHVSWWAKSPVDIRETIVEVRTYSLFRIYGRNALSILSSTKEAFVNLAFHRTLSTLLMLPLVQTISVISRIRELKKILSVKQKK